MTNSVTSLDRLHDIVLPAPVPLWPPAPGWYVVLLLALALVFILIHRVWSRYRANAYRRAALRELALASDAAAIAELLRRTALAIAPRPTIAEMSGTAWPTWLAQHCPTAMPDAVHDQLGGGVYRRLADPDDLRTLHDYATLWITTHRHPTITDD